MREDFEDYLSNLIVKLLLNKEPLAVSICEKFNP